MKNEIMAGLKNALERGESLEKAKKTFVNAGYNSQEVESASKLLTSGISELVYQNSGSTDGKIPNSPALPPLPSLPKAKNKKKSHKLLFILILVIFFVLASIGYLIYLLVFK